MCLCQHQWSDQMKKKKKKKKREQRIAITATFSTKLWLASNTFQQVQNACDESTTVWVVQMILWRLRNCGGCWWGDWHLLTTQSSNIKVRNKLAYPIKNRKKQSQVKIMSVMFFYSASIIHKEFFPQGRIVNNKI